MQDNSEHREEFYALSTKQALSCTCSHASLGLSSEALAATSHRLRWSLHGYLIFGHSRCSFQIIYCVQKIKNFDTVLQVAKYLQSEAILYQCTHVPLYAIYYMLMVINTYSEDVFMFMCSLQRASTNYHSHTCETPTSTCVCASFWSLVWKENYNTHH